MLRILAQAAVIGAFAFALSIVGLSAWRSFYEQEHQPKQETSATKPQEKGSHSTPYVATKENSEEVIARYNFWLVIFTGVLAFVALIQIGFLIAANETATKAANAAKQAANAAIEQLRNAERTLVLDQRPWIGSPEIRIEHLDGGIINFILIFKNGGRTPTNGLFIDANIVPGRVPGDDYNWRTIGRRLCEEGKKRPKTDPINFNTFSSVPGSDWPVILTETPSMEPKSVTLAYLQAMEFPHITGCVLYGSRLDQVIHKTGFVARLNIKDSNVSIAFVYALEPD